MRQLSNFVNRKSVFVAAAACLFMAQGGYAADTKAPATPVKSHKTQAKTAEKKSQAKVIVYSFYGNSRCSTCREIEQYTKETVEQNFSSGTYAGRVAFISVNFEENSNKHFVKDYQLVSASVILQSEKDGKPGKWENLDQVWTTVDNKAKFVAYVKSSIIKALGGK